MEPAAGNMLVRIPVTILVYAMTLLPAFATLTTVVWSLVFDFEGSVATHCKVANYLPTVSAVIGRSPQSYIWNTCIYLHTPPRLAVLYLMYKWQSSIVLEKYQELYTAMVKLANVACFIEILGLVVLTRISSTDQADIHEVSFIVFIAGSWICMVFTVYLLSLAKNFSKMKNNEKFLASVKSKKILTVVNVLSFSLGIYMFVLHNSACRPLLYTYFALCEYVTIFTNIAFYGTCLLDLHDQAIGVTLAEQKVKFR